MKSSLPNSRLAVIAFGLGMIGCALSLEARAQSILYICGNQKGNAGTAFDHGLIDYIASEYAGGTVTPTLSSLVPGTSPQGLYDPHSPTVTQSYDFDTFDCVVLSSTVTSDFVPQLMTDLKATSASLLVLNEESLVDLRMVDQPPFSPIRSGPKAASKPFRQKQFPSSLSRNYSDCAPGSSAGAGVSLLPKTWLSSRRCSGEISAL